MAKQKRGRKGNRDSALWMSGSCNCSDAPLSSMNWQVFLWSRLAPVKPLLIIGWQWNFSDLRNELKGLAQFAFSQNYRSPVTVSDSAIWSQYSEIQCEFSITEMILLVYGEFVPIKKRSCQFCRTKSAIIIEKYWYSKCQMASRFILLHDLQADTVCNRR